MTRCNPKHLQRFPRVYLRSPGSPGDLSANPSNPAHHTPQHPQIPLLSHFHT